MNDQDKTKEQLINELAEMRRRIAELEAADTERKQTADLMRAQRDLSLALSTVPGLDETLRLCLEAAFRVSGMDCGGVYLVEEASGSVDLVLHKGLPPDFVRSASHYDADSASARLVMAGKPIYARHQELGVSLNEARRREALRAIAIVPVRHEGRVVACLNIASHTLDEVPDSASTALETMASQIGSAVVRSRMKETLREGEQRLALAVDGSNGGQWHYELNPDDPLHAIGDAYFSPLLKSFIGYEDNEFPNSLAAWESRVIPEDLAVVLERSRAHRAGQKDSYEMEYRIRHKDGSIRWIYSRGRVRRDERGRPIRFAGIDWDITERKRAEEALRESEELLRATLESTADGILVIGEDGKMVHANTRFAEMWRIPQPVLDSRDDDTLLAFVLDQLQDPEAFLTRVRYLYGSSEEDLDTLQFKDGRVFERFSRPLLQDGMVAGRVWSFRGITERKRAEEARQQLYEQAQQDAKTKSFLLDEVNHRVKNTLTAIIGLLNVEQSYAAMADHATYEAIILNLTNRVSGLATVHSLLSASEWAPLPLSDLAGQVIKSTTQMCPRDKQVFIDAPPSPVRVTPDQAHNLALVINELATNTIQHTLPGRSTARISVRIALEDDVILFEYRDDGPGYPEDVLQLERHAVGFDLIKNLTRRNLQGELSLHNDEGAVAVIRFPAQA